MIESNIKTVLGNFTRTVFNISLVQLRSLPDSLLGFLLILELTLGIVEVHVGVVFKELLEVTRYGFSMGYADIIIGSIAKRNM